MKFSISTKQLQHDLAIVAKVIQKKNTLAILDYAMVSKDGEQFFLTGASTENRLTIAFDIRQTDGEKFTPFCIDANQFLAILGTLPEQPIDITVDEAANFLTTVTYDGGDFQLPSMSATEFPIIDRVKEIKTGFSLSSAVLMPCLKAAQVCTKVDDLRPIMSAVCLDTNNEGVTFVGTDGQSLYRYIYAPGAPFLTAGEPSTLLLHRALTSAIEAAFGKAEEVKIVTDGRLIEVSSGGDILIARTLEGRYPNYNSVIPKDTPYHVTLEVSKLASAVKRVSMMSSSATGMLVLSKKNGILLLSSEDIDFSRSAKTQLQVVECTLPDNFRIGMKAPTVTALLGNIATGNVRLELIAPEKPVLMHEDAENSALTELFMPILINDNGL